REHERVRRGAAGDRTDDFEAQLVGQSVHRGRAIDRDRTNLAAIDDEQVGAHGFSFLSSSRSGAGAAGASGVSVVAGVAGPASPSSGSIAQSSTGGGSCKN